MSDFIRNYKPLPGLSSLDPGIEPGWKYGVLILPAVPDEKVGSIIIAEQTKDDEKLAAVEALLVAVSPTAFKHPDWPAELGAPYGPGDHVLTEKFPAGLRIKGRDGRDYMLCRDEVVIGKRADAAANKQRAA